MQRPRIDLDDDTLERVSRYAEDNGLRMPRAYAQLIETGLEAEGVDD